MSRVSISKKLQYQVWVRNNWRCFYCRRGVIFSPALKELELINPGKGYYDQHGSRSRMLALFENLCACCDHKSPVAKGGRNEIENLVTCCFQCNREKSDSTEYVGNILATESEVPESWDGMVGIYNALSSDTAGWKKIIAMY